MTCKECALWDIEAARDRLGRVRKTSYAPCLWKAEFAIPYSVTLWLKPKAGMTRGDRGEKCPCFQKREE
jgi:hypothetical protein